MSVFLQVKESYHSLYANPYNLLGGWASLHLTVIIPLSGLANALNAASVKSIGFEPGLHPAQVSTTRTKTQFLSER